jgi:hypothetical protein
MDPFASPLPCAAGAAAPGLLAVFEAEAEASCLLKYSDEVSRRIGVACFERAIAGRKVRLEE